jgi:hypothetical protein
MVTGDGLKARRYAREIVGEMRWRGMTVPRLYARMAGEFEDLVRSGGYAAWVAANQRPALTGGPSRVGGVFVPSRLPRNGKSRMTRHAGPVPAGRMARRRRLLPGSVLGR